MEKNAHRTEKYPAECAGARVDGEKLQAILLN